MAKASNVKDLGHFWLDYMLGPLQMSAHLVNFDRPIASESVRFYANS